MACSLEDVRNDSLAKVRQLVKGNAKAVRLEGNTAIIDYGSQYRIKNRNAAYKFAQRKVKEISDWASDKFGKEFTEGWSTIDMNQQDRVKIHLTFPSKLNKAYEVKKGISTIEEISKPFERDIDFYGGDIQLMEQEQSERIGAINQELTNKLSELFPEINVTFTKLEGLSGQANIQALSVLIDETTQKEDTLPHEYAHHYIRWFINTPIVQEAINKWGSEEALVQAIGEQVVKQKGEALGWWKEFSKWIKTLFENITGRSKEELRDILTDAFLSRTDLETYQRLTKDKITTRLTPDILNQVNAEQAKENDKVKKVLQNIIKVSQNRYKALTIRKQKELAEKEKTLLERLENIYKEGVYLRGIQEYIKNATEAYEQLYGRDEYTDSDGKVHPEVDGSIGQLKKRIEDTTFKEVVKESHKIRSMGNFATAHYKLATDIINTLGKTEFTTSELKTQSKELIKQAKILRENSEQAKTDYADFSKILYGVFLKEFGWTGSTERLGEVLSNPVTDISGSQRWLNSMADVQDEVLRMAARAIVSYKEDARKKTIDLEKDLIELKIKLEKAGIKTTNWVYKFDENGIPTGDYITERDWSSYYNKRNKFYDKFKAKFKIEYKEYNRLSAAEKLKFRDELSTGDKTSLDNFKKDIKNFFKSSILTQKEAEALISQKQQELSEKEFKVWEALNVEYDDERNRYTVPREIDSKYNEIQVNPLKKEFYDTITNLKVSLESHFPDKMKHPRRAPQLRKDVIERIKVGDIKGITNNIKEHFKVMDDENQRGFDYGVEDERGSVINFVPIYYTKKLSNPSHLSTDAVSTIMEFARMSHEHEQMTTILDILEIGKDVLFNRGVLKKNNKGNTIKVINEIANEKIEEEKADTVPGNIYEMYVGFMDMLVYGRLTKEGKNVWGVDVEKFLDSVGKYTAVMQLGLNIFAGAANVLQGKSQLRIEAASREFFGYSDLVLADKIYGENLPGALMDVGSRLPSNKLTLWNEYMDVMEDFNEKVRGLDVEQRKRISKLFRTSNLFFLSHAGEHYMHSKGVLATAMQFRFSDGRFVKKKDFFKPVEDLKDKMRIEIRKQTSKEVIGDRSIKEVTKEIQSKYNPEIETLQKELDTKWKSLTNFWDAHEVKNNRLTLKSEFQNEHSDEDRKRFIALSKSINQSLHGVYNTNDRNLAQQQAIWRLAIMFRKWMKPYWDRRFQKLRYDQRKEANVEGYYNTAWRFIAGLRRELREGQFSIYRDWALLTDTEKANFRRVIAEAAYLAAVVTLATILTSMAGDDDEWAINYMAYQANRLVTEIGAFVPYTPLMITENLRLLQNPMASVQPAQEIINFLQFWNWNDEITRGKYEGMTKFEKGLLRSVPLGKTISDWSHPQDKLVFYQMFR